MLRILPGWKKAVSGKTDQIRHCISCTIVSNSISQGWHIRCAVNTREDVKIYSPLTVVWRDKAMIIGADRQVSRLL